MSSGSGHGPRRRSALAALLRDATRLDRTQSDPAVAARNALGVAAPLAIGVLAGDVSLGLAATVGAIQASFADRPGPYRLRLLRMLGTSLAAGVTSSLAVVASGNDGASVTLLFGLALIAGLLLAGGPSATQVGIAGVAAALVLGHLAQPTSAALHVGLLVLAGGAGQCALAVWSWPLRRHRPERAALAALYRELAHAARLLEGSGSVPPATSAVTLVRQTFYGLGHDHGPSVEAYRVLLDEAERVRREIVLLGALVERLAGAGAPIIAGRVRVAVGSAGDVLDEVARSLDQPRTPRPDVLADAVSAVDDAARHVLDADPDPGQRLAPRTRRATAARLQALAGQLRAIVEGAGPGASEGAGTRGGARTSAAGGAGAGRGERAGRSDSSGESPAEPGEAPSVAAAGRGSLGELFGPPIAILRANLTWESAVLRHAVRTAALVAGSDLVVRAADLSRGYWVPLTVLVVLRPDFGSTVQRAVLRTVGTILGLVLASELARALPAAGWWPVALVAVFAFGMRLAGPGNVGLSAVGLSGLVVVLLELEGVPTHATEVGRAVATACGGALSVLAVLVAPAWERRFVPSQLATLIDAYREYLLAATDFGERGDERERLRRARGAARLARTNAEASVDRAAAEPVLGGGEVELGRAVLAHSHRLVRATLAIDAMRSPLRESGGAPSLRVFAEAAAGRLAAARALVSGGQPQQSSKSLRPDYDSLAGWIDADPGRVGGPATALAVLDAADRMTNSVDTMIEEIRRWRHPRAQVADAGMPGTGARS